MWERAEAEKVMARLDAAVAPYGCRLAIVGGVATRGFSDKDLDIALHVDGERDALERALGAIDAIRHERTLLVCHLDNQLMFVDAAFRSIEVWLHAPSCFWRQVQAFTDKVWRRVRADKIKAVSAVRRARARGRPVGMERVPLDVFERERERLAAYIGPQGKPLVEARRAAHEALIPGWTT
jgi:hypothetical protein